MEVYATVPWDGAKMARWACDWLDLYRRCQVAGTHGKWCKCKTGPPAGVLVNLIAIK